MTDSWPLIESRQFVPPPDAAGAPYQPLDFINASAWEGTEIPPLRWLVPNRIPMANVTLLQGDGGMGKTTIALQLCVAVDQDHDWLGSVVNEPGPTMFVSAEEDADESLPLH